ncbi:MAG TPA: hypothetical protein VGK32_09760 [Vicinamibacterales bacterium]|jgi:hypothetical protein
MKRVALLTFVMVLAVAAMVMAQAKPDFSGTWAPDTAKSDQPSGGRGPGGPPAPMTVKQTATELTREMKRGEQTMATTYKLDGTESVNKGPMGEVKSTAKIDGAKLVIKTVRETPNGTMESTETWSLSADGKELTVVSASPRGERKTVYTKQ